MEPQDITCEYNYSGYRVLYKGVMLCGSGVMEDCYKKKRKNPSDLKLFRECAKREKNRILYGVMPDYIRLRIMDIEEGKLL